jgi:hypothetical protein
VGKVPVVTIWFWLIKVMISGADVAWPDTWASTLGCSPLAARSAWGWWSRCQRSER